MFSQECVKYNVLIRWLKEQLENGKEINKNDLILMLYSLGVEIKEKTHETIKETKSTD
jgi:hypothetical protein